MDEATNDAYSTQIERHILRERSALVALADFAPMLEGFRRHLRRWDVPIDDLSYVMARQALGGLALQLSCRPAEESLAYTFNVHQPAMNVFAAGRAAEGHVVGRVFLEGVETTEESRLFVESVDARNGQGTRSTVAVKGLDLLLMYEQYFEQSVQLPTRFFELQDDTMIMVQGMPQVDASWIGSLNPESAHELIRDRDSLIEARRFRFRCGCTAEKLIEALTGMWGKKPEELFQGDDGVEISCPRCGARWWIDRELFDTELLRRQASPDTD